MASNHSKTSLFMGINLHSEQASGSVAPFRGDGERWSLAFNVMAIPKRVDVNPVTANDNVELFSVRKRPQGF